MEITPEDVIKSQQIIPVTLPSLQLIHQTIGTIGIVKGSVPGVCITHYEVAFWTPPGWKIGWS